MKSKDWLIIVFCLILSGVLLTAASMRVGSIHQAREDMGLVANTSLENAPPSLAFATVAMGAFRGVIVDILWMRADTLKDEGKFFDAKQLRSGLPHCNRDLLQYGISMRGIWRTIFQSRSLIRSQKNGGDGCKMAMNCFGIEPLS